MISTLRQAFHDPQSESATRLLFDLAISTTYERFYCKLNMIKDMRFHLLKTDSSVNVPPIEMFEKLVTKMGDVKEDTKLIKFARAPVSHGSGGEGSNALKRPSLNSSLNLLIVRRDLLLSRSWKWHGRAFVTWRCYWSTAISSVASYPMTLMSLYFSMQKNLTGCGRSGGDYGAFRVIGQTQS